MWSRGNIPCRRDSPRGKIHNRIEGPDSSFASIFFREEHMYSGVLVSSVRAQWNSITT